MDCQWLSKFDYKKIIILGYGLEGKSTYNCLKTYSKHCELQIMDSHVQYVQESFRGCVHEKPFIYEDQAYLIPDSDVDYIFKSPGIPLMDLEGKMNLDKVTSQSNEFIAAYGHHIIGITGTKGKSTTVTYIHELLDAYGVQSELVGNIGLPAFDRINQEKSLPYFVYELSSHQLETVKSSPKYAVVLNLFEEHLDHYKSYGHYAEAKMNIARWQTENDFFIYSQLDQEIISRMGAFAGMLLPITTDQVTSGVHVSAESVEASMLELSYNMTEAMPHYVKGHHNLINMSVGVLICMFIGYFDETIIDQVTQSYKGLDHRLSYVANVEGVDYYNDSISTIPQATIAAIQAIPMSQTIIVGGMNRGIDYSLLLEFIQCHEKYQWVMLPDSGHELFQRLEPMANVHKVMTLEEAVNLSSRITEVGKACLLSPAAASYGFYKNFEARGRHFESLVKGLIKG